MIECPICQRRTEARPCECGYDFTTGDRSVAERRALAVMRRSTKKAVSGAVVCVTLPLLVGLTLNPLVALVMVIVVPIAGVGWLWRGLSWRHAARQRLVRAREAHALPAARLIKD